MATREIAVAHVLEGESIRDEVFAEINFHVSYEPQRCVRTKRWKYIQRFDDRQGPVLPNVDRSLSKDYWLDNGWRDHAPEQERLYDLIFDPNESNNLINDPQYAEIADDLRARLDKWMRETDDPLIANNGIVPTPDYAILNSPDDLHPTV